MKNVALLAAFCSLTLAACIGQQSNVKEPKFDEGRGTMAKIGGRPLPVFEFSAKVDDEDNKIVGARAFVSTTAPYYRREGDVYKLVDPKPLAAEYIRNVSQVRATVDPAKEEELATHLNSESAGAAFQIEVDWTAPESTEQRSTRSNIFETDHPTIASAGAAKEVR